jgi:putative Holliday junction resolvase
MPLLLWDERWSTQAVERAMIAEDLSRRTRAERVDRLAAAYILQGAIDALTLTPLPPAQAELPQADD